MRQPFYIIALFLLLLTGGTNTFADYDEEKLKAAYIFNFSRFASWPELSLPEHLTICIITENSPGAALKALETRSVNNRKIDVRYYSSLVKINGCAVAYLPSSDTRLQQQLIDQVQHRSVLTISNGVDFVEMGGMIGFVEKYTLRKFRQSSGLGFAINLNAAKQANIKLSSKLLDLATNVKRLSTR